MFSKFEIFAPNFSVTGEIQRMAPDIWQLTPEIWHLIKNMNERDQPVSHRNGIKMQFLGVIGFKAIGGLPMLSPLGVPSRVLLSPICLVLSVSGLRLRAGFWLDWALDEAQSSSSTTTNLSFFCFRSSLSTNSFTGSSSWSINLVTFSVSPGPFSHVPSSTSDTSANSLRVAPLSGPVLTSVPQCYCLYFLQWFSGYAGTSLAFARAFPPPTTSWGGSLGMLQETSGRG